MLLKAKYIECIIKDTYSLMNNAYGIDPFFVIFTLSCYPIITHFEKIRQKKTF